jgi:hypothetical protein
MFLRANTIPVPQNRVQWTWQQTLRLHKRQKFLVQLSCCQLYSKPTLTQQFWLPQATNSFRWKRGHSKSHLYKTRGSYDSEYEGKCLRNVKPYSLVDRYLNIGPAINYLTPWRRVLLEKLTGPQLVKKFPAFYGPWVHHQTHNSSPPVPILI